MKIGDLVKCHGRPLPPKGGKGWSNSLGEVGTITTVYEPPTPYDPPNDYDITVLIRGEERVFMRSDVEVIE